MATLVWRDGRGTKRTFIISKSITRAEVVAYEELGPEAIRRLEVKDLPATVINDIYGGDLYIEGKAKYRKTH